MARKTIMVRPAYTVPALIRTLEDGEMLCPGCRGEGQVRTVFGSPGHKHPKETCWTCNGSGVVKEGTQPLTYPGLGGRQ